MEKKWKNLDSCPPAGIKKLLLIMRLTIFLTLVLTISAFAETYSQNEKLDLSIKDATIEQALLEIENTSRFIFIYEKGTIDKSLHRTVSLKDQSIEDVLNQIFEGTEIGYKIDDRQISLFKKDNSSNQGNPDDLPTFQSKSISGKVTDTSGKPLPGVTIVLKGTTNGTITDFDGNFTISNVTPKSILVFSFVGMKTKEIPVTGQSTINLTMREDAIGLDEIVAVGYGIQKKSNVTGSIASVDAQELNKIPATNTSTMLAGRLPGLNVRATSGQPGADEANLSIRGFGNALVIVDGVPRDFQQLDPNEIESISVLKDASAAVYGARAGNGVILVTTKKGKRDSTPKINYTGNFSFQQPTIMYKMADAAGYASYYQEAEKLAGVANDNLSYSDEDIAKFKAGTEPGYQGANWQDQVFKNWAPMQQHNINVTGGTDKVNYFLSLGNLNQNSLLRSGAGTFKRYNISSNIDVNITKRLKAGLNLKYREENRDDPNNLAGDPNLYFRIFRYILHSKPTVSPIPDHPDLMAYVAEGYQNAVAYARQDIGGFSKDKRKQFDMIFSMDYKLPVDGLSLSGKLYHKSYDRLNRSLEKPYTVYKHDYTTGENIPAASLTQNMVGVTNWKFDQLTTQLSVNYEKKIKDHSISAMALAEYYYEDKYEFGAQRTDLVSSDIPYLYSGNGTQTNYDIPDQSGRKSIVSRVNYNYKEKYLVELLFRADASIQFPKNTRWGYFPGVSVGWRLSEEPFLQNSKTINYWKLRASYASLGYDAISNFDYLTGYELQNAMYYKYDFGDQTYQSTLQSIGLANTSITWESMNIYNLGTDLNLWNGLLGVEFDAFYRLRTGLLEDRMSSIPSTFGADLPKENLGKRDNRGFELVLNHSRKIGDLKYHLSGNLTWTREKYVYEEERQFDPTDPDDARLNKKTGNWVNRTFGYKTDGFYNTQDEINNDGLTYPEIGEPQVGDIKYVDTNGDHIINYRDQVVIGRGNTPELYFGLNADVQYKNFDFSMLWQGAGDFNIIFRDMMIAPNLSIGQIPLDYEVKNAWNPDNPSAAKLAAPNLGGLNTHNSQPADIYLRNATYLRLKTLNIGYTLPSSLTTKAKINKVRVFAAGYNLLTIQPNDIFKFDPETSSSGGALGQTYPIQRVITLGVNVTL